MADKIRRLSEPFLNLTDDLSARVFENQDDALLTSQLAVLFIIIQFRKYYAAGSCTGAAVPLMI